MPVKLKIASADTQPAPKPFAEVKNVEVVFSGLSKAAQHQEFVALRDVSFQIYEGEFLVLIGPSGCGKSTLLYLLSGLLKPSRGELRINDKVIDGPSLDRGLVFQEYAIFPWLRVKDNIAFGLRLQNKDKDTIEKVTRSLIDFIGLTGFEEAYPKHLSGGMKQRVAIARALAVNPRILLMDEPFGALDAFTRNNMQKEIIRVWEETRKTIIFVTHSIDEAILLGDRIIAMAARPGRIKRIVPVNLPRPRSMVMANPEQVDLKRSLVETFKEELDFVE